MEEKKLISEINRINELMGNNLLTENVGKTVVNILQDLVKNSAEVRRIFVSDSFGLEAYRRLEAQLTNWKNAAVGGQIPLDTVIDDLWTVSQRIPEVRLAVTDFMLSTDRGLRRNFDNFLKNREGLERMRNLTNYNLRNVLEGNIRAWFGNRPVTDSQIGILTDRLLYDVRRNLDLPPEGTLDILARKLPIKSWRYLGQMLAGVFQGERRLQRKFADAARRAEKALLSRPINPAKAKAEAENMMAILSSAKKWKKDGFEEVYNKWKDDMLRDPQYNVKQSDFDKFDEFKSKGGKEFWDNLTTLLPSFTEETLGPWMKLWPYKMPNTPGGWYIFSDKLWTRDWWERLLMTILVKSPRTMKDYITFLKRRGVAEGTIQLLFWRFFSIHIIYPALLAVQQAIPSTTEKVVNDFVSGLNDFFGTEWGSVELGDTPTENLEGRFLTNFLNSIYSSYLTFDLGEFLDQQSLSQEIIEIGECAKEILDFGDLATCLNDIIDDTRRKVKEMDIPEDIKKVTLGETGVPVGETSDSGSSDDPFGKTSTENKP
jgi:hypothetical protein